MLGSLMYLLGSIFWIPATNNLLLGEIFFIVGSAVIAFSQACKCYRTCVTPPTWSAMDNIKEDLSGFLVDLFAGLGGLFYLIGTIIFSTTATMDQNYIIAIVFFTLGGLGFMISAISMQIRYFFSDWLLYKYNKTQMFYLIIMIDCILSHLLRLSKSCIFGRSWCLSTRSSFSSRAIKS